MPAAVACTGLWRSVISTNSSISAVKVLTVSIMAPPSYKKKASAHRARRLSRIGRSGNARDVGGLLAFRAGDHIELDAVALRQDFEAIPLDRGEVDEHVLAPVLLDEPESLALVEPFD